MSAVSYTHLLLPYYGLGLRVFNASDYNASDKERRIAARGDFFIRDKMQTFVAAIPGPGHQWLEVKLPPEPSFGPWVVAAVYSALGLLLCAFMLVWALPIWRDLEAVSYTHLDVYKRQAEGIAPWLIPR